MPPLITEPSQEPIKPFSTARDDNGQRAGATTSRRRRWRERLVAKSRGRLGIDEARAAARLLEDQRRGPPPGGLGRRTRGRVRNLDPLARGKSGATLGVPHERFDVSAPRHRSIWEGGPALASREEEEEEEVLDIVLKGSGDDEDECALRGATSGQMGYLEFSKIFEDLTSSLISVRQCLTCCCVLDIL